MADNQKKEDFGTRAFNTLTMLAAPFIARKAITVVWTKVTGKKPPDEPGGSGSGVRRGADLVRADRRNRRDVEAARDPGYSAQGAKRRGPRDS